MSPMHRVDDTAIDQVAAQTRSRGDKDASPLPRRRLARFRNRLQQRRKKKTGEAEEPEQSVFAENSNV